MNDAMRCSLCDFRIQPSEEREEEQFERIVHVVDHALRAVLKVGVYDVGACDVGDYFSDGDTWSIGLRDAREFVLVEYGDYINSMAKVFAQIPLRPIGRPDAPAVYTGSPVSDAKAAMIEWLDQNAQAFRAAGS